jgi:hypothetical protein
VQKDGDKDLFEEFGLESLELWVQQGLEAFAAAAQAVRDEVEEAQAKNDL